MVAEATQLLVCVGSPVNVWGEFDLQRINYILILMFLQMYYTQQPGQFKLNRDIDSVTST